MDLQSFGISEKTGFCLEEPLTELDPAFSEWHRVAINLPDLINNGTVREEVDKMPQLNSGLLSGHRELILAHLQLANIAAAYVWGCGDDDVVKSIPACLAVPLYTVSKELGLPTGMCHANRCLANWALVDPKGPIVLENIRCLYPLLHAGQEGTFFTNVVNMTELEFAPALKPIVSVLEAVDADEADAIPAHLRTIAQCLHNMEKRISRLHELELYTFLYAIVPYTRGWGAGKDNPIPDGLIFEGVSETPIKTVDDTAGQSCTMQTMDAFLGVRPSADGSRSFHLRMRENMLPRHRRFIDTIEQRPKSLRDFVYKSGNREVQETYNQCLEALAAFRSKHFQMFAKYFLVASKKKAQEAESRGEKGEAPDFTDIGSFLKDCRQSTSEKKLSKTRQGTEDKPGRNQGTEDKPGRNQVTEDKPGHNQGTAD